MLEEFPDEEDETGTGIQVYIGHETSIKTMKDCSLVTTNYDLGNGMRGTIGIVGPKRMDYDKMMALVNSVSNIVNGFLLKMGDEQDEE